MATITTSSNTFTFNIQAVLSNLLDSGQSCSATMSADLIPDEITQGVSEDQISRAWEETITLSSGGSVTLDLRAAAGRDVGAGSGKDALGQTLLIEEVMALIVQVTDGDGILEINKTLPSDPLAWIPQNAARHSFGGGLRKDGLRMWFEPDTAGLDTTASAKNVRFDATNDSVTFRVLVFGRHDDDESSSSSTSSSSSSSSSTSSSS